MRRTKDKVEGVSGVKGSKLNALDSRVCLIVQSKNGE